MGGSRRARWATALLVGTVSHWPARTYTDQVFQACPRTGNWVLAAPPLHNRVSEDSAPSTAAPRFAVLAASAAALMANRGTWQPAKADIDLLEASLDQVANLRAENLPRHTRLAIDHPERYFRQYVAIVRKGKRLIYINAFCNQFLVSYWRQQLVVVFDGGSCCWQAIYDPAQSKFSALRIDAGVRAPRSVR